MAMADSGFIERHMLGKDEVVVCAAEKHPFAALAAAALCYPCVIGFFMGKYKDVTDFFTAELVVTNRRLIGKKGLMSTYTMELMLDKVSSIEVEQGVFARAMDYGTLIISTDGRQRHTYSTIKSPYEFKRLFDEAMEERKTTSR